MNKLLVLVAVTLFILSCFLTAFYFEDNGAHVAFPGYACYMWTFPAIFGYLCTWPNVLMPLAVIVSLFNGKSKILAVSCVAVSCLCIPLSLSFLTHSEMMVKNTAASNTIVSLGAGFYAWMGTQVVLCIFIALRTYREVVTKIVHD